MLGDLSLDQIRHLPTIPLSLLQSNYFLNQFLQKQYPQLFFDLDLTEASARLHLPWLSIVGIASFIANVFRLLPFDQASVGRKLTYSVLGSRADSFVGVFLGILKTILLLAIGIFSDGSIRALPKELLFQYLALVSALPENAVRG